MFKVLCHTLLITFFSLTTAHAETTYPIVDTGVKKFYGDTAIIQKPQPSEPFWGQDAHYQSNKPSYSDNRNGTVTDEVTGLVWQKVMDEKMSYDQAKAYASNSNLGGYNDWRIPSIKELYSLILFTGQVKGQKAITPFIDTQYFEQPLGDTQKGEREIDAQTWSATEYVGKTMNKDDTVFGVNFIDGRIKGYPKYDPRTHEPKKMYFRLVRGNPQYGENQFVDNGNGTVTDLATGLMWQKNDNSQGMDWQDALEYAETLKLGGYDDWRLPNAKELQSIVDYSRSPETTGSPAIDPIFTTSSILNEARKKDYPYYWSSTTHLDGPVPEKNAAYVAFGRAMGKMHGSIMDVHGSGAQRSDPKIGEPMSRGPQGDMIRVDNYVRCVRAGSVQLVTGTSEEKINTYSSDTNKPQVQQQKSSQGLQNKDKSSHGKNRFMTREDKNRDGNVSRSEFKGPSEHFSRFDKNNDGYITSDEAPKGRP